MGAHMKAKEKIANLEKLLHEAYDRIQILETAANRGFRDSHEYSRMKDQIHNLELMNQLQIQAIETDYRSNINLAKQTLQIRNDNVELCKEHGVEYWEGIALHDRYTTRELERENSKLKAKVQTLKTVNDHYKRILSGNAPEHPERVKTGRPPIHEEQKKRIRKLRKDGWTIREIADAEGLSTGSVSKICSTKKIRKPGDDKHGQNG